MSTRTAKQLIYGAFYIVIFLAICAGVYFIVILPFMRAPISLCTPSTCAPTSTAPLATSLVGTFITSPSHYTFLAQVANADPYFGASAFDYEVDLYDASGTVLQSINTLSGEPLRSFIYANQNKYILIPNMVISQPFDHAGVSIEDASWLASSTLGASAGTDGGQFAVQNSQGSVASTTVSVGGQVTNTGVASYGQVIVMVFFKDVNGNIIGASQTELDNVVAGETTDFSVIYPNEPSINPALNQVIVYALR
jgi:hypothetical protein